MEYQTLCSDQRVADGERRFMSETDASELVRVATALVGPGATDDQIANQFERALLLMQRARDWLEDERQKDKLLKVAEEADAADQKLPTV